MRARDRIARMGRSNKIHKINSMICNKMDCARSSNGVHIVNVKSV